MGNDIEITTMQHGKKRLERLESVAAGRFKRSSREFNRGMEILRRIRDTGAWHYALDDDEVMLGDYQRPKWENYIRLFCDRHRIGRSTTFAALNTIDTWYALGLPKKALQEVGLNKAKEIRHIARYDGRSGQLELPSQDIIEQLPPGKTPVDRVRKKVEEVLIEPEEPLTPKDVRDSFTIDTGAVESVYIWETGGGRVRYTYEEADYLTDGILIEANEWSEMDEKFKEWLVHKVKIVRWEK